MSMLVNCKNDKKEGGKKGRRKRNNSRREGGIERMGLSAILQPQLRVSE